MIKTNPEQLMKETLLFAIREAEKILMHHFGHIVRYEVKENQSSIVTQADFESEMRIKEIVAEKFPDHNFLGEETGFVDRGSEFTWVIDPVDGTSNFAAGLPWFGVIICLLKDFEPILAGCFLPYYDQLYLAERGKGTTVNGHPVHVSEEKSLKNVLFACSIDYSDDFEKTEKEGKVLIELVKNVRNFRATNSLVDYCYTADGRLGGCINQTNKVWDVAGPDLIIREAGGNVTDIYGQKPDYSVIRENFKKNFTFTAANPVLHEEIVRILNTNSL
jgi:myo-inositol-1(or 4)-monophosphatase